LSGAELWSLQRQKHWARRPQPGPLRTVPVGAVALCEFGGRPVRMFLGTLFLAADSAGLSVIATASAPHPGLIDAVEHWTATDDRGTSYRLGLTGDGDNPCCEGVLHFDSALPVNVRWLDVTPPGAGPIRVDIESAPPALPTSAVTMPADTVAERYLDALAIRMLWRICGGAAALDEPDAAAAVSALLGAGVLTPGSMALGRLAATASRLGLDLGLASVPPPNMPEHWLGMLQRRDERDGRTAVAQLTGAVLPELDGVWCVIDEIVSKADHAVVRIQAWGWPIPVCQVTPPGPVYWTAHDDLGGFYAASQGGRATSDKDTSLVLELRPAIHPAASDMRIVLTGRTGEVSVTVPLDWQDRA
jgi:hypothetical protein